MAIQAGRKKTTIVPFWNRMPRFFLYPVTPPGLYVLFALSVLFAFIVDVFVSGHVLFGLILLLVAGLFTIKYGYDILERTAHGELTAPRLNHATLIEGYEMPFKQYAVFFLLGLIGGVLGAVFPPVSVVFTIAWIALLPAIVMTLAIERSVFAALNPRALFGIAGRLGGPYWALFGMLLLLNGGSATAMSFVPVDAGLSLQALAFFGAFAQVFFWFVMMHLMGYLLYQYHDRLGFEPEALAEEDDGWGELLDPVEEDIDAGAYVAAANRLQALINQHPEHALGLRQRRHQVLKLGDDPEAVIDNAGHLLGALIDANRLREATEVYLDITNIDPDLRPGREQDFEPLMQMLVQRGEYRRAVRMVNGFHKAFPNSEAIPPLYLEVARVMSDHLGQPAMARQVAEFLARKFPDHPAATRARALRDAVTG